MKRRNFFSFALSGVIGAGAEESKPEVVLENIIIDIIRDGRQFKVLTRGAPDWVWDAIRIEEQAYLPADPALLAPNPRFTFNGRREIQRIQVRYGDVVIHWWTPGGTRIVTTSLGSQETTIRSEIH